mmetsp:Transcript_26267/g.73415  ORF Transcript_26267/g.73415 Transcript_26267/m.73415 type:complete len:255 (+) Transcript_26267:745-1509(+)
MRMSALRSMSGAVPSGFRVVSILRASLWSIRIFAAKPFITTVSSPTSHMWGFISAATTRSAPARAASMESSPEPAPTSRHITSFVPKAFFTSIAFFTASSYLSFLSASRTMSKCHRGTWECRGRGACPARARSTCSVSCQTSSATSSPPATRVGSTYWMPCLRKLPWGAEPPASPPQELSSHASSICSTCHVPTAFQSPSSVVATATRPWCSQVGASAAPRPSMADTASARSCKSIVRTSNGSDILLWPRCESS